MKTNHKTQKGFTLIELIVFVVISSLLLSTILAVALTALRQAPNVHRQWLALQSARLCLEGFLNQRRLNGYTSLGCPSVISSPLCVVPSGFSISTAISCTTWNSDTEYKTITVSVTGLSAATLSVQIGDA